MSKYTSPKHIHIKLERLSEVLFRNSKSRSTHYLHIQQGLWTPSIVLGERCVAWPAHETDALIAAMIVGKSQEEIKELVKTLVEQRKELMEGLL